MQLFTLSILPLLFCNVLSTPLRYSPMGLQCNLPTKSARFDCHPDPNPNQDNCVQRGCCWQAATESTKQSRSVGQGIPYCYYPQNYNGYNVSSVKETDYGYRAVLARSSPSGWPDDIKTLTMDVWLETAQRLHFKVTCVTCYLMQNPTYHTDKHMYIMLCHLLALKIQLSTAVRDLLSQYFEKWFIIIMTIWVMHGK